MQVLESFDENISPPLPNPSLKIEMQIFWKPWRFLNENFWKAVVCQSELSLLEASERLYGNVKFFRLS